MESWSKKPTLKPKYESPADLYEAIERFNTSTEVCSPKDHESDRIDMTKVEFEDNSFPVLVKKCTRCKGFYIN